MEVKLSSIPRGLKLRTSKTRFKAFNHSSHQHHCQIFELPGQLQPKLSKQLRLPAKLLKITSFLHNPKIFNSTKMLFCKIFRVYELRIQPRGETSEGSGSKARALKQGLQKNKAKAGFFFQARTRL